MKPARTHFRLAGMGLAAAGALVVSSAALAAGNASDRQSQYLRDRAACEAGHTGQDLATCLREAAAVRDERRETQNRRAASEQQLNTNAMRRCERLPASQQESCRALIMGQSTQVQGSVPAGGVYREMTIQTPVSPAAPIAPAPPPASPGAVR